MLHLPRCFLSELAQQAQCFGSRPPSHSESGRCSLAKPLKQIPDLIDDGTWREAALMSQKRTAGTAVPIPLSDALQTSLYPDYGRRIPRAAARRRDLALIQFTGNCGCGHRPRAASTDRTPGKSKPLCSQRQTWRLCGYPCELSRHLASVNRPLTKPAHRHPRPRSASGDGSGR